MTFTKTLTHWYSVNKRDLPWRHTKTPYFIWLSEIILQQTQINQGLPYYEAFVSKYPTVFDLAKAKETEVLKLWQGLGYYSRARNLHTTAKYVASELNGKFPTTYIELLKLKGVGDYTASAIASICFGENTAVVDGNVYRVLSRFYGVNTPINSSTGQKEFKALAQSVIDNDNPADFNQAIMEFGATQCKPKSPNCNICPLQKKCKAYRTNTINNLPVKIRTAKISKKYYNFLVILTANQNTFLEKREGKGIWQNLYQFPLIETKKPIAQEALISELKEYPLLKNMSYELLLYNDTDVIHKLSHQHLYTKFWIVQVDNLPVQGIALNEIHNYPVPVLIANFIKVFDF